MGAPTKRVLNSNPYRLGHTGPTWSPKSNSILGVSVVMLLFMMVVNTLITKSPNHGEFHHDGGGLSGIGQRLRASNSPTVPQQQQAPPRDSVIEMTTKDFDETIKPVEQKGLTLQQEIVPKEVHAEHHKEHGIHVQPMEDYHFDNVKYFHHYTKGKPGIIIQDMLMAHAYAFHMNGTYGGCCPRKGINYQRNKELLAALGLDVVLPFACPNDYHDETIRRKVTVQTEKYHSDDTRTWTPAYVAYLKSLINYPSKSDDEFVIVAHVQRGDVTPCRPKIKGFDRYLPNQHYLDVIDLYYKPGARVEIITQSDSFESLDVFHDRGYRVHIDDDLLSFWRKFMLADVVILSRSEMSLIPAVCAMGDVVFTPYWHQPIRGWHHVPHDIMTRTGAEIERLQNERCPKN